MDVGQYHNLSRAIVYKFQIDFSRYTSPGEVPYVVEQTFEGISLTHWDEAEMGEPEPDEATMLQWIQEFEALSNDDKYPKQKKIRDAKERLRKSAKNNKDLQDILFLFGIEL